MNTRPRDYNQEYQAPTDRQYQYDFDKLLRRYMLRAFQPFLRGCGTAVGSCKVLELGCFQGEFTELLAQHYDDLTVVEAADELIQFTQARVGDRVQFIHSVFETVELPQQYDVIFLIHTLEHLDDPVAVLHRINQWLSPTGRLFVVVPNANAPSRQIAVKMGLIDHNAAVTQAEFDHGHRITYGFDTLERDAVRAGLQVVNRGGVFFKALANFQFDQLMGTDIISDAYLEGCYQLGMQYPELCASIYLVCEKG